MYYGTTAYGGVNGDGTVFQLQPPSIAGGQWHESIIHSFENTTDGFGPSAGVIVGKDGVLYGVTAGGGPNGTGGTVFALSPPTVAGGVWQETVLYAFSGAEQQNGYDPSAALVLSREQILYGTTASGGTSNFGTVFAVPPTN